MLNPRNRTMTSTAFSNAKKVFECIDTAKTFDTISEYVEEDATFNCQAAAMNDLNTVKDYSDWMVDFGIQTVPGYTYDVHYCAWDENTKTAMYFATFHATHTGPGGPVEPTNKTMHANYTYCAVMNEDNKITEMTKVWNDGYSMTEIGWA